MTNHCDVIIEGCRGVSSRANGEDFVRLIITIAADGGWTDILPLIDSAIIFSRELTIELDKWCGRDDNSHCCCQFSAARVQ